MSIIILEFYNVNNNIGSLQTPSESERAIPGIINLHS